MNRATSAPPAVLYTGAFRFPDGDAAAFRVYSIAQVLAAQGHEVAFAGWESGTAPYDYQGHACYPQSEFRERALNPVARFAGFLLRGMKTLRWLARNDRFGLVIAYNPPALFALALLALGRLRGFAVALDSTEWYEGSHLPGGTRGPAAIENWCRMRLSYPRFRHVIAISGFLTRYFAGRNVVRVPPLRAPAAGLPARGDLGDGLRLMYAGDAGKKDKLLPVIAALPQLNAKLARKVELHIAGLAPAALDKVLDEAGVDAAARAAIVCHGRVTRERVFEMYGESHFSILFREDARYAWAGFPTKAVESWSSGCPIITNAVGDLKDIAVHLENAIVVDEPDLIGKLVAALSETIETDAYARMAERSLATAEACFAPHQHAQALAQFVQGTQRES